MVSNKNAIRDFLDSIADDKLKNFVPHEETIVCDKAAGFRLDHQGKNQDGSGKDRLYIQSLGKNGRGKSKASQCPPDTVIAQVHVTDPADPKKIREALLRSAKNLAQLIDLP